MSCVINQSLDGGKVCLGPGYLCSGGTFVEGPGSKPVCKYDASPASFILFMFLISIIIIFEKIKNMIHHAVPKAYMPVIHAIFAELSTLGFVSLIAFLLNFSISSEKSLMDKVGYSISLGHELHNMFEHMHWLLFGVTATFLCLSLFLLRVNLSQLRRYESWSDQIEEGVDVLHLSPNVGQHEPRLGWMRWTSRRDEMEVFLRVFSRFVDVEAVLSNSEVEIPKDFNLGLYLMKRSSAIISAIIQISPLDWLVLLLLSFVAWIAWYVNAGESTTDGGYVCFWIYDILLLLLALAVDYKLHTIMLALVPVDPNNEGRGKDGMAAKRQNGCGGQEFRDQNGERKEEEQSKETRRDGESAADKLEVSSSTQEISLFTSQFDGALMKSHRAVEVQNQDVQGCAARAEGQEGREGNGEVNKDAAVQGNGAQSSEMVEKKGEITECDLDDEIQIAIEVTGQSFGTDPTPSPPPPATRKLSSGPLSRHLPASFSMSALPSSPVSAGQSSEGTKLASSNRLLSFSLRHVLSNPDDDKVIFDEEFSHRQHARFVPRYLLQADSNSLKERSEWRRRIGGRVINHHQELFWFDKNGPGFLLRIIRHLLLASVVMIALSLELFREKTLCLHLSRSSERRASGSYQTCPTTVTGVFLLILSLLPPVFTTLLLTNIIRNFVTATSVEYLKSRECIVDVIHEQQHRRTLRLFRLLISIASVIDQIKELKLLSTGAEEENVRPASKEGERRSLDFERMRKKSTEKTIGGRRSLDGARNEKRNLDFVLGTSRPSSRTRGNIDKDQDARNSFEMETFQESKARNSLDSKRPTERSRFSFETLVRRSLDVARGSLERNPRRSNKIPEHVLKHLKEIFDEADRDGSGQLDLEEFRLLLQAIGAYEDEEQTMRLFEMIDMRGDGKISFQEFSEVMAKRSMRSTPDEIANKIWTVFDPSGKGKVTPETAVEALLKIKPQFDVTQVFYLLWTIDIQRKHHVTKMEFVLFVKRLFEERSFAFQFT